MYNVNEVDPSVPKSTRHRMIFHSAVSSSTFRMLVDQRNLLWPANIGKGELTTFLKINNYDMMLFMRLGVMIHK